MSDNQNSALINPHTQAMFLQNLNGVDDYGGKTGDWFKKAGQSISGVFTKTYKMMDKVSVERSGKWVSATITDDSEADNGVYGVTYADNTKGYDIPKSRIKRPGKASSGGGKSGGSSGGGGGGGGGGAGIASALTSLLMGGQSAQAGVPSDPGAGAPPAEGGMPWGLIIGGVLVVGVLGVGAYLVLADDDEEA